MTDIMFVAVLVAFFALCVLFVRACERIIGPDLEAEAASDESVNRRAAA